MLGELGAAQYLEATADRSLHDGSDAGYDLTLRCGARVSVRTRDASGSPTRPDLLILSNSKARWTPRPTLACVLEADNVLALEGLWLPDDPYSLHTFHAGAEPRLVRPFADLRDVEEIRAHVESCSRRAP